MNWINATIVLTSSYFLVFLQTTFNPVGLLTGTQVDLLPVLMVYAGLSMDAVSIVLLAVGGGLWLDSFSLNPLGVSLPSLLAIGFSLRRYRDYILRNQAFAQMVLGGSACIAAAALTLLTLFLLPDLSSEGLPTFEGEGIELVNTLPFATERRVGGGWRFLEQAVILGASGAIFAPLLFKLLEGVNRSFNYPAAQQSSFRPDREIKRGSVI